MPKYLEYNYCWGKWSDINKIRVQ